VNRHHFKSLGSTNDWAKQYINKWDRKTITLITTEEQTNGRGRFGRRWYSPPKENLYASFVFFMEERKIELTPLVQLLAYSTTKILENQNFNAVIKWPNDIFINSKKVAGILCETIIVPSSTPTPLAGIILGIGMNVNMPLESVVKIDQPATSLMIESNKEWDMEELTQSLAIQLAKDIAHLLYIV
jgi:BirA family biotin operon repressor/biotin-[acetyl-CoA-carboxylase] ligase